MTHQVPTNIRLHQKSCILELSYDDGTQFDLSCEYLRVYSPSAEVRGHSAEQSILQVGKENISIIAIEPVGSYAIKLVFSDGHDTGIYSWDTLYQLGVHKDELWEEYIQRLEQGGYTRTSKRET